MAATALTPSVSISKPRAIAVLILAAALATALNAAVAAIAVVGGVSSGYGPLTMPAYLSMTVLGIAAGWAGWQLIRRRARNPRRTLGIVVPLVLVASFLPDVMLAVFRFIPGTTLPAVLALSVMHVIVAAVAVPAYIVASRPR